MFAAASHRYHDFPTTCDIFHCYHAAPEETIDDFPDNIDDPYVGMAATSRSRGNKFIILGPLPIIALPCRRSINPLDKLANPLTMCMRGVLLSIDHPSSPIFGAHAPQGYKGTPLL